jgi:glycosyltransferase involved in cell wall biosynthesis
MILTIMTLWIWLRQGMDILHVYNPPDTLFVCSILPRLAGKTIIYHLRDLGPELYLAKFNRPQKLIVKTLSLLEGISCRLANHIIVVNGSYQEKIMERQKIYPEQITIIRQGPDLDRIQLVDPILEVRFRAKTIIAFIGYMAKQDGIDHLLKSLYYLDRCFEYHEWLCLLIGSSETPHEIEAMAEELGIRDRIWLTG